MEAAFTDLVHLVSWLTVAILVQEFIGRTSRSTMQRAASLDASSERSGSRSAPGWRGVASWASPLSAFRSTGHGVLGQDRPT